MFRRRETILKAWLMRLLKIGGSRDMIGLHQQILDQIEFKPGVEHIAAALLCLVQEQHIVRDPFKPTFFKLK